MAVPMKIVVTLIFSLHCASTIFKVLELLIRHRFSSSVQSPRFVRPPRLITERTAFIGHISYDSSFFPTVRSLSPSLVFIVAVGFSRFLLNFFMAFFLLLFFRFSFFRITLTYGSFRRLITFYISLILLFSSHLRASVSNGRDHILISPFSFLSHLSLAS